MRGLGSSLAKFFVATLVLAACCGVPASAQDRVALVVGNSAYKQALALPNPVNDAAAVAAMLEGAGFRVVLRRDIGINDMRRTLREFTDATRNADIALIFFAGHGIEIDGENYLIPVDAILERDIDVDDETVSLDRMLRVIEPARSLRLVILDACRDNPFSHSMKRTMASRSIGKGLAKVEPTVTDTLIAFAAKAGSTASDGAGPHSPYTAALLRHLPEPGLDLRIALGRVRDEVMLKTERKQEPFYYGSLGGSVIALVPGNAPEAAATTIHPPPSEQANLEITFWNSIKDDKNPRLFEAYLHRYPNGAFADIARIALEGLKTAALAPPADRADDSVLIADAVTLNEIRERLYELNFDPGPPDGPFGDAAREAIREFEEQSHLPRTGAATQGLLRRLRAIGGLKPWGAIVYGKDNGKWGMAWGENTRRAAVAHARDSCGDSKSCPVEISFFGTECGVFAYSGSNWAISARDDIRKAKDAALSECRKRGKSCDIVASVCADGAERYTEK
jgi:Caspase domain/Domain of unknown function (DUF4189)/Putative peptidoglycan binding domain